MSYQPRDYVIGLVLFLAALPLTAAQSSSASQTKMQIVFLGTGTPLPDPQRAGPSTAVVVNGKAYIVDAGTGLVRRAAAGYAKGIAALRPRNLRIAFLTHLHSDHTLGLPDLMITPWIMGRKEPLELYGPPGTRKMVDRILDAYDVDRNTRINGLEHSNSTGWKVNVHEIKSGVVFKDSNLTVKAFPVRHGTMAAFGYQFATPDRTIVLSGDTAPTDGIEENCHNCDVLVAEAYTQASFALISPEWQRYRESFHMSTQELGAIASRAKPKLLILFHRGNAGCDQAGTEECREAGSEEIMLGETQRAYSGNVVAAHDLDVY